MYINLCPFHTTGGCPAVVPWLEVVLRGGTTPRSPQFVGVVHTTDGRQLIGYSVLTVNNSRMTVLQMMITVKQPQLSFGSCQRK